MTNIVFLDAETLGPGIDFSILKSLGNYTEYSSTAPEDLLSRLDGVEIAIANKTKFTAETMKACTGLKLICVAATGMNNIDLDYAAEAGIAVKNVAGYSTDSVVQLTYAMLFALSMRISVFDTFVKSGDYSKSSLFTNYDYVFSELAGKQIGIIGLGTIGKKSAEAGIAFGAKIAYYSTSGKNTGAPYPRLELDELLATSDVVLIHAPLNDNTRDLINADKLKLMKPTAFLVNTGRGYIVNEADLAEAIDSERIAGAALDVFAREPMQATNPLLAVKHPERLILTPHIAWTSLEARTRLLQGVAENIKSFLADKS